MYSDDDNFKKNQLLEGQAKSAKESAVMSSHPSNSSRESSGQDNFNSEFHEDDDLRSKGSSTAPTAPSKASKTVFYDRNWGFYKDGNGELSSTDGSNRTKFQRLKDAAGKVGTKLKNAALFVPSQVKESYQGLKEKVYLDDKNKVTTNSRSARLVSKNGGTIDLNRVDVFNNNYNLTKGQRAKVAATKVGLAAAAPLHAAARGLANGATSIAKLPTRLINKIRGVRPLNF
jgi:hypothetical protein